MSSGAVVAAVERVLADELSCLDRDGLLEHVRLLEQAARMLSAAQLAAVAELERRGIAQELAAGSTAVLLGDLLRLDRGEARARVRAAEQLAPRATLSGQPLPALFAATAALLQAGTISVAHATAVTRTVDELPDPIREEQWDAVEATLSGLAATLAPAQVATAGRHLQAVLDPDGTLADEAETTRRRDLVLRRNRDGSGLISGRLTGECLAVWQAVLDPLGAPRPAGDEPDPRTPGQRAHDGLLEAGRMLLRSDQLPAAGGVPATVLLSLSVEQLEQRSGLVTTGHGGTLTLPAALALAADAQLIPAVFGRAGQLIGHGRTRRLATATQRLALAARDRGCSFPGCSIPAAWCDTHHITAWADGGVTDLDNLTLLCGYHHREHQRRGWTCRTLNGIPHWIPPRWIDPHQAPRRNTTHHPSRILFEQPPLANAQDADP